ncbi:hypothetical protein N8131_08625 [Flavobacteriaceae bacterium]|nr:hypothetical protein [Flavobacteriaceae bacterium]
MKTTTLILFFISAVLSAQQNQIIKVTLDYPYSTSLYPQTIKTDIYDSNGINVSKEIEYNSGYIYRTTPYGKSETAIRQRSAGSIHTYEFDGTVNSEYGSREPNSMSTHSDGSFSIYDSYGGSQRYRNGTLISKTKQKPNN